jgi:hypothetical protein
MDPDFEARHLGVADTHTKDLAAWLELRHIPSNRFNLAGHIDAQPTWLVDGSLHLRTLDNLPLSGWRSVMQAIREIVAQEFGFVQPAA